MEESAFGKLGRNAFTRMLLSLRPIDVVKMCWLTNLHLCDQVSWSYLLQKGFGIKPDEIPQDSEEQRQLFYDVTTRGYSPFYVSIDSGEEMKFEELHTGKLVTSYRMPTQMQFLGFQKVNHKANWIDRANGFEVEEIKEHPLKDTDIVYLLDDPNDLDVAPLPNPQGETLWTALLPNHRDLVAFPPVEKLDAQEFVHIFSIFSSLDSNAEYSADEINKMRIAAFCTDVIFGDHPFIFNKFAMGSDETKQYSNEIFDSMYNRGYYVIDGKVYQIGKVKFLPLWK